MKPFAEIHEMSKDILTVKDFVAKMTEVGCTGGSASDSYVYEKDGITLVVAYRPVDDKMVGAFMTTEVFQQLQQDFENTKVDLSLAYFAWTYGYGVSVDRLHMAPQLIMEHLDKWHDRIYKNATRMGTLCMVDYVVTVCEDTLPDDEYGVQDEYFIVGVSRDVRQAEYMVERGMAEEPDIPRDFRITPIKVNVVLKPDEQVLIGGSHYIE